MSDLAARTTGSSFDAQKAEAFAGRLLSALNDGALCLMASIGHRTGLFDAMRDQPPQDLGRDRRAGRAERALRARVAGSAWSPPAWSSTSIPQTVRFQLPAEHAAFLTRPAAADNIAVFAQYIALLGSVEDDIVECFKKGGGVPYERYPRFHAVMAEDSGQSVLSSLESHILPLVPGLADRLTRGHPGARRRLRAAAAHRSGWPSCSRTAASSAWTSRRRPSRRRAVRLAPKGLRQRRVRGGRSQRLRPDSRAGILRLHHDLRRHSRSGQAAQRSERHPSCAQAMTAST